MTSTKATIHTDLLPYLLSRKNFYHFLHSLFLEPINDELFLKFGHVWNFDELKEVHEGGRILAAYFDQCITDEKISFEKQEYRRLFIGPGTLVAPPWESYYRSKERLLFEQWTFQIRELYHHFGLKYVRENNEPDDHLLLELEFMIFLLDLTIRTTQPEKIKELLSTQIHFLKEHLTIWIPHFCKCVRDHTKSRLYLGAAMLLEDFLNFDLTSILEVKEAIENV